MSYISQITYKNVFDPFDQPKVHFILKYTFFGQNFLKMRKNTIKIKMEG